MISPSETSSRVTIEVKQEANSLPPQIDFPVRIYPNPSQGESIVEMESPEAFRGQIYVHDLPGRIVLQQGIINPKTTLDIAPYSAGIDLIRIVSMTGKQFFRKINKR